MKILSTLVILLALTTAACGQPEAGAQPLADLGRQAYAAGRYAEAAKAFAAAYGHGAASVAVGLDTATAFRLAGDPGRAALWLYRAARLGPRDPDVRKALAAAGLRPPSSGLLLGTLMGPRTLWLLVLGANALFWLTLAIARVSTRSRRLPRVFLFVAATFVVWLWCEAGWLELAPALAPRGVILADTPARCAPEPAAEPLFSLPPGEIVRLGPDRQGYRRVDAGGDRLGWIPNEAVTALAP